MKFLGQSHTKHRALARLCGEDREEAGNLEGEGKREAGDPSEADLNSLIFAANLKVSIRRHDEEKEEISRKLCEANQMNEELTGPITRLQTERASLRSANSQLEKVRRGSLKLHVVLGWMTSRAGEAASEKPALPLPPPRAGSTLPGN